MIKTLIIGSVWPEPKSSAAGSHMMQLIAALQSHNYQITFASASQKSERAVDLSQLGIDQLEIKLNDSSFDDFITSLTPEMVIFDRFMTEEQFGWRVSENCPNAMRVLNTEDLHGLRKAREMAVMEGRAFDRSYYFNDTAKREIASIFRSDLSLIISDYEMELLQSEFNVNTALLHYFPFAMEAISATTQNMLPAFSQRRYFISIGNFLHAPNYHAVLQLKEVIWPLIRSKLPEAELHIYGSYMPQKMHQFHNESNGFILKGTVEDANEVMKQAKVCLAPLRFGAGLKGKLVEAMCNGTPCVTTSVGAEGLFGTHEPNGYVEDDPGQFAEKAIQLYTNEAEWSDKQRNGFQLINDRFSRTEHEQNLGNKISEIKNALTKHRSQNFMGAMLLHQSLHSTKFMSKWIEEKNK
ncbi:MAG: glycosyltransferase family 4 protein [Flavobacteriaceae bacterium]|nr:glycosyltransferase family 4 protein [Flavobacteriaceae bacterium]